MRSAIAPAVVLVLAMLAAPTTLVQAQPDEYVVTREGVTRAAFLSDAQHEGARETLRQMVAHLERANASLLLYGGDTSYGWGDAPPDWLDALGPYAEPERMLFVYGNHDGGSGYRTYQPAGLPDVGWWSATVGDVVVVGLDTNEDLVKDSPQVRWLTNTLAEQKDAFVVLMMHKPWWVPNVYHDEDSAFSGDAEHLAGLVAAHDVDLVLAGHQHYYARHDIGGASHVIAGPADALTREVPAEVADAAQASAETETALVLDVSACGARVWTLAAEGVVMDAFEAPAFAGSLGDVAALDDSRVCLAGDPYPYVRQVAVDPAADASARNQSAQPAREETEVLAAAEEDDDDGDDWELPDWAEEGIAVYVAVVATALLAIVVRRRP